MSWRILQGDVTARLAELPAASVQCVITSPPYWGLRDYGTATWTGGAEDCAHTGRVMRTAPAGTEKQASNAGAVSVRSGDCICGAVRTDNQIGLEPSPELYVARLVDVFRQVRRVLRDDGTLWLNLGDSYATQPPGITSGDPFKTSGLSGLSSGKRGARHAREACQTRPAREYGTLKPKDLVGIPWLVAFALRADGWYLRSDIIWKKPNPMPESVTDRPTKAHEYLFLLAKAERYFYDADAIAEAASLNKPWSSTSNGGQKAALVRNDGNYYGLGVPADTTRNRRTVWTVTPEPFAAAHFAVMPQALAEPCLLAGSRPGDLVLDPFAGSGTVGVVALRHGRDFVGIDLSAEYCAMAAGRIAGPLFANDGNEPATKPAEQPQLFEQST